MSTDPEVERCLRSIRELSDALVTELVALSPAAWDGPTNCAPWRVRDLAAHIVSSGEGFVASIRQGLAGSVEPSVNHDDRQRRQAELESADPATVARALHKVTDEFEALYASLNESELEVTCFHRRGNRSVRWYAAHRLAEVAFHSWDLHLSLGQTPQLDEQVAALLLPTLLESNAPRTYAAGLTPERGRGERYLLSVANDPETTWLVTIDDHQLTTQRVQPFETPADHATPANQASPADRATPANQPSPADQASPAKQARPTAAADAPDRRADLTITGSAAALALLVYGRSDLADQSRTGALQTAGNPALLERFALIFPRP